MIKTALLVMAAIVSGCATVQTVSLLPRGPGSTGTGTFDQLQQELTVEIDGAVYKGTPITATSYSQRNVFGQATTTTTNQQTALLIGPAGQIRCEFMWGAMKTLANGTCVDRNNVMYDLLIRN